MDFNPIHNARLNFISWGSVDMTASLAKDGYFQAEPNSDETSVSQDAGSYRQSISVMPDKSALITIQLDSQSPANTALTNVLRQERALGSKTIANLSVFAVGTVYLYEYIGCHIHKRPSENKSVDMADNTSTWVFHCAEMREKDIGDLVFGDDVKVQIEAQVSATIEL